MFYSGRREKDAFNEFNRLSVNMVLISESEANSEPEVHVQSVFYHHNNFIKQEAVTTQLFNTSQSDTVSILFCICVRFCPQLLQAALSLENHFQETSLHQRDDNNCVGRC